MESCGRMNPFEHALEHIHKNPYLFSLDEAGREKTKITSNFRELWQATSTDLNPFLSRISRVADITEPNSRSSKRVDTALATHFSVQWMMVARVHATTPRTAEEVRGVNEPAGQRDLDQPAKPMWSTGPRDNRSPRYVQIIKLDLDVTAVI